jgi:DNA-binding NarL/FixJ family response regulator
MKLLLCDDHELFMGALADALRRRGHLVVAATTAPSEALDIAIAEELDCCILDLDLGGESGLTLACEVRRMNPSLPVVILSAASDVDAWSAYNVRRIQGMVSKGCALDVLERTLNRVVGGERVVEGWAPVTSSSTSAVESLTDREREVLLMLVDGASTTCMSDTLSVSVSTIRAHVQNVMRKLGVQRRTMAVQRALDLGLAG